MSKQPWIRIVSALLVALLFVTAAQAQAPKKNRRKGKKSRNAMRFVERLKSVGLTEEQQQKVKALVAKYSDEIKKLQATAALRKEQKQARAKAQREANEKGLKGKKRRDYVAQAASLSEAQKEALAKLAKLQAQMRKEVLEILTPEQKQKLRQGGRKKKARG